MKKFIFKTLGVLTVGAFLSACSMTLPVTATSNSVGSKVGTSKGTCYLGTLCFGVDASVQSAAKNGGISKISTVDLKVDNVLNLLVTYECIVTGD